ncbi:globin domain-containing protein [Frankia sp. QA3]|uniref:globin domain-containing protein n=1 Tax=Frankia sp. QA3 TaxID=710111 RepID=UPI000269CDB7|nr:globin domain-containing protein [Frankia sp. QA3]EIV96594.1 hemoglobin-like flavoprotein [Frankia sp. QA3]
MLSERSAAVVGATAGVVAEHAVEITAAFYPRMFAAHPELLHLFNQGNQATGEQRQALAAAVVAYAGHLLGGSGPSFAPVLRRIAHKHVSLGVRPEQYTIVGQHLLAAVGEVLGDAVTREVHDAWDEVYWLFATALIAEEGRISQRVGADPQRVWRPWRVTARTAATAEVVSFDLVPAGPEPLPTYLAGQYISVAVDLPGGGRQARQYSLSRAPGAGSLRITVRRVPGAGGAPAGVVSSHLHDQVKVGDILDVSPPTGDVTLATGADPLVLISAGIGVTPMIAMLGHTARLQPERPVVAVHADRSPDHHALRSEMIEIGALLRDFHLHTWYESGAGSSTAAGIGRAAGVGSARGAAGTARGESRHTGALDLDAVPLPDGARAYLCGPLPFLRDARAGLLRRGVPAQRIRYEIFGPDLWAGAPA